mmetsp:Transcript_80175/g.245093  ORF Transcript_80175/g.245093 Transcript_80175/m.245093 type:complete len:219 (+) Transcript_80175:2-658(+)
MLLNLAFVHTHRVLRQCHEAPDGHREGVLRLIGIGLPRRLPSGDAVGLAAEGAPHPRGTLQAWAALAPALHVVAPLRAPAIHGLCGRAEIGGHPRRAYQARPGAEDVPEFAPGAILASRGAFALGEVAKVARDANGGAGVCCGCVFGTSLASHGILWREMPFGAKPALCHPRCLGELSGLARPAFSRQVVVLERARVTGQALVPDLLPAPLIEVWRRG